MHGYRPDGALAALALGRVGVHYYEGILTVEVAGRGITVVRHEQHHFGVHRHMDGGEVIASVRRTTVHLRWSPVLDDPGDDDRD